MLCVLVSHVCLCVFAAMHAFVSPFQVFCMCLVCACARVYVRLFLVKFVRFSHFACLRNETIYVYIHTCTKYASWNVSFLVVPFPSRSALSMVAYLRVYVCDTGMCVYISLLVFLFLTAYAL